MFICTCLAAERLTGRLAEESQGFPGSMAVSNDPNNNSCELLELVGSIPNETADTGTLKRKAAPALNAGA